MQKKNKNCAVEKSNISPQRAQEISCLIVAWYKKEARALPFREGATPYQIWVSEIMGQQTRMDTLLPYYTAFTKRFPDIAALAAANEEEVLKQWQGLGYYSRARNLHKAARMIMEKHGGELPNDEKMLHSLPGIGEYTAGAILSIAFSKPVPAVDGNVLRVMARVENYTYDIARPVARAQIRDWVAGLMQGSEPSDLTQALMELGALLCLPKQPQCDCCPLNTLCRARKTGRERELPIKSALKKPKTLLRCVLLCCNDEGELLLHKREESLLQGLWEYPSCDGEGIERVKKFIQQLGLQPQKITPVCEAVHVFTHIRWEMTGYLCCTDRKALPEGWRWTNRAQREALAIPAAYRAFDQYIHAHADSKMMIEILKMNQL